MAKMSAGLQVGGGMKGMLKDGYKHFSGLEQAILYVVFAFSAFQRVLAPAAVSPCNRTPGLSARGHCARARAARTAATRRAHVRPIFSASPASCKLLSADYLTFCPLPTVIFCQ